MKILRVFVLLLAVPAARAQVPGMYPWWEGPLRSDIGLSEEQNKQINATLREMRSRMIQLRSAVELAEGDLKEEMDAPLVDVKKTGEAIEKVVAARGDLMRAVAQMSLRLRLVLTPEQWLELQKRKPKPGDSGFQRGNRARPPAGMRGIPPPEKDW